MSRGSPERWPDVVCLSTNHWTGLPTSKQHLMSVVARSGRVLYVDPPIDVFSAAGRRRRWGKFLGLRCVAPELWVLSPVVLSSSSDPGARAAFYRRWGGRVAAAAGRLGFVSPVLWSFAPEHVDCAGSVGERLLVYHVADEPRAFSRSPEETARLEKVMIERADLVFAVSKALADARAPSGKVRRLRNAADARHYRRVIAGDPDAGVDDYVAALLRESSRPIGRCGLQRPVVLYGGAAYDWFDEALFFDAARARPSWSFVVAGPVGGSRERGRPPANVRFLGRRPYDEFSLHLAGADVVVMPWRDSTFSRNADPIVMYEALVCGRPVVATPFPAALEAAPLVRTADGAGAFVEAIEDALADVGEDAVRARVERGLASTWEDRAAEALEWIRRATRA